CSLVLSKSGHSGGGFFIGGGRVRGGAPHALVPAHRARVVVLRSAGSTGILQPGTTDGHADRRRLRALTAGVGELAWFVGNRGRYPRSRVRKHPRPHDRISLRGYICCDERPRSQPCAGGPHFRFRSAHARLDEPRITVDGSRGTLRNNERLSA